MAEQLRGRRNWEKFTKELEASKFWERPSHRDEPEGKDGCRFVLEALDLGATILWIGLDLTMMPLTNCVQDSWTGPHWKRANTFCNLSTGWQNLWPRRGALSRLPRRDEPGEQPANEVTGAPNAGRAASASNSLSFSLAITRHAGKMTPEQTTRQRTVAKLFFATYLAPFVLWIGWGLLSGGWRSISRFNLILTAWMILLFPSGLLAFIAKSKNLIMLAHSGTRSMPLFLALRLSGGSIGRLSRYGRCCWRCLSSTLWDVAW